MLTTDRLVLRALGDADADFIVALLNEPSFLRFIGDRGVRTADDARRYLADGPLASYQRHGHGLLLVQRTEDGASIGICGLLKRDTLEAPDIGFALRPAYWGRGYAFEAAAAVMAWGRGTLALSRIEAVTLPDNAGSIRVLEKLGMQREGSIRLGGGGEELTLYAWNAPALLPLRDHAATPVAELAQLRRTFASFTTLGQLLDWGRDAEPVVRVDEVIAQDEYSHDALVPLPDGRYLAFDTT